MVFVLCGSLRQQKAIFVRIYDQDEKLPLHFRA